MNKIKLNFEKSSRMVEFNEKYFLPKKCNQKRK